MKLLVETYHEAYCKKYRTIRYLGNFLMLQMEFLNFQVTHCFKAAMALHSILVIENHDLMTQTQLYFQAVHAWLY